MLLLELMQKYDCDTVDSKLALTRESHATNALFATPGATLLLCGRTPSANYRHTNNGQAFRSNHLHNFHTANNLFLI